MKHALLLSAVFGLACATERPQLTSTDAYNPDAPTAAAQQSGALAQADAVHDHHAAPTYSCPMHPEVTQDHPGECPKCGMKLEPAATPDAGTAIYFCPMHPEITQDQPGRCPKCNMKLERRK